MEAAVKEKPDQPGGSGNTPIAKGNTSGEGGIPIHNPLPGKISTPHHWIILTRYGWESARGKKMSKLETTLKKALTRIRSGVINQGPAAGLRTNSCWGVA